MLAMYWGGPIKQQWDLLQPHPMQDVHLCSGAKAHLGHSLHAAVGPYESSGLECIRIFTTTNHHHHHHIINHSKPLLYYGYQLTAI